MLVLRTTNTFCASRGHPNSHAREPLHASDTCRHLQSCQNIMYIPSTGQPPHLGYRNQIMTVISQSHWLCLADDCCGSTGELFYPISRSYTALSGGQNSKPISCGHLRNRSSETRMVSANTEGPSREMGLADMVCSTSEDSSNEIWISTLWSCSLNSAAHSALLLVSADLVPSFRPCAFSSCLDFLGYGHALDMCPSYHS